MRKAHFQIRILFFLSALIGIGLIQQLNFKVNPSPQTQHLSISFEYPGAGPELVEREVTAVLERFMSRLDHLITIESSSKEGRGQVKMTFDKNAEIDDVRLMASTLIRQVFPKLPRSVSYPRIHYESEFESYPTLMVYAAVSSLAPETLSKILDKELILPLSSIEGIHAIEKTGLSQKECLIELVDEKLHLHGLTYDNIRKAVSNWSSRQHLGLVHDSKNQQLLSIQYRVYTAQEPLIRTLELLPIKTINGRTVFLKDIANLRIQNAIPNYYYRINGNNSINIIIRADQGTNHIKLASRIKHKIKQQQPQLSGQVDLLLETDRSNYLSKELDILTKRILAALSILSLFMLMIYRSFKRLWPIWCGFFVTLLCSTIVYYFVGLELHLYSLAGLTLSLGIILDNLIIAGEHLRFHQHQRIFLALLAATLTTVGALSIIFFISPSYREQLTDFAWIFFINLGMSLLVGLFFLPTIINDVDKTYVRRRRLLVRFSHFYGRYTAWTNRRAWFPIAILVVAFGIPLFLLPAKLEQHGFWSNTYNKIMQGNYGKKIHPVLSNYLGGSLRLFVNRQDQFFFGTQKKEETKLYLRAKMPFGGTLEQLNSIITNIEGFLSHFPQIKQFTSMVGGPNYALIEISFKDIHSKGIFPYQLKSLLESKVVQIGSGSFQVYGIGQGFNNELLGSNLTTHLRLLGYNYDQLWEVARQARDQLLQNLRIKEVFINPTKNFFAPSEAFFELDLSQSINGAPMRNLSTIATFWKESNPDQGIVTSGQLNGQSIPIRLTVADKQKNQLWRVQNAIFPIDSSQFFKNSQFSRLIKRKGSSDIVRYNQQYQLYLEYDFIGNSQLAREIKKQTIKEVNAQLPPGYSIKDEKYNWWWEESTNEFIYIVLGALILIFLISAVLFNSIKQAFIPLVLVPPAFIGIFLATHLFEFKFDQGGFAALLLVAGLSVNAGIFIINDYNNFRKSRPNLSPAIAFVKAYNSKIIPIVLTTFSTILGLLPFVLFNQYEPFWYALAIGTIAGTTFSIMGLVLFLPMFFGTKVT